jgi:flagellar export protein FliJ
MARVFRFRLETVQRLRKEERDRRRRAVAEAAQAVRSVQQRIDDANERLRASVEHMSELRRSQRIDVHRLRLEQYHRGHLQRQVLLAGEALRDRQVELDARRAELAEATMRLRVVEKLRQRQWDRHRAAVSRDEQTATDEIAAQQYLRRSKQRGEV